MLNVVSAEAFKSRFGRPFLTRWGEYQFLLLQILGWTTLTVISFLSLTLWYKQDELQLNYTLHTLVQSMLGVLVSWPLRGLFSGLWDKKAVKRLFGISFGIILASALWTVSRIVSFMAMTGEREIWLDFGGWIWGSIIIFIGWASLYHGIKYYQLWLLERKELGELVAKNREIQLQRSRAELVARNAQLKMLRYQLNPHFLFNTLNAISALTTMNDTHRANSMIVQLSNFLRYSLDNDPEQLVALEEEIRAVDLYLRIEKTRFSERLRIEMDIDPASRSVYVPSLILQPLVENSVKYAIAPQEKGGKISIVTRLEESYCALQMSDSGTGGSELEAGRLFSESSDSRLGVGLRNTIDRLENFYGKNYVFKVTSSDSGGLSIFMRIPLTSSVNSPHALASMPSEALERF